MERAAKERTLKAWNTSLDRELGALSSNYRELLQLMRHVDTASADVSVEHEGTSEKCYKFLI